ncbi:hypothetical protein ACF3OH_11835 [Chryseomicrobium aureum]|uniref:hypothetical protein n=1 Tax=Chryseomicrobium aureum TaxID=1441723 RepID=UPI00370D449E
MKNEQAIEMLLITYLHTFKVVNKESVVKIVSWYYDGTNPDLLNAMEEIIDDFSRSGILIAEQENYFLTVAGIKFTKEVLNGFLV